VDLFEQYLRELKSLFWENNMAPDISQIERLANYAQLVVQKNEVINLISRKDTEHIIENHVFMSSLVTNFISEKAKHFLDIGTGGGFPGIPITILRPLLRGVLADSTGKKIDAVSEFIKKLKLSNATAVNARVESPEFIEKYKESFDLFVSRATVPVIVLVRYALPLMKEKAKILALKGGDVDEEIKTAETKYKSTIKKATVVDLKYKPSNVRNEKDKKLIILELMK
jgi:16S rRNA (guanine527-N7)-methyltransferase